jgi:hypothetical protein
MADRKIRIAQNASKQKNVHANAGLSERPEYKSSSAHRANEVISPWQLFCFS